MFTGNSYHGKWCNAWTMKTNCWYCGAEVFVFGCDCGCRVLFESLGQPWPRHICIEYLENLVSQISSKFDVDQEIINKTKIKDIRKFDPDSIDLDEITIKGIFRDPHYNKTLTKKGLEPGTLGYNLMVRFLDNDKYNQFTIIDDDFISYTILSNPEKKLEAKPGMPVLVSIQLKDALKEKILICKKIELLIK